MISHFTTCSAPLGIKPDAVQNHSPCIQHTEYISIFDKVNMIKNCIKVLLNLYVKCNFSALSLINFSKKKKKEAGLV